MAARFESKLARLPSLEVILGGVLALLTFTLSMFFLDARNSARAISEFGETQTTLGQLDDLSAGVERVVTIARVFVLTGTEDFLRPLEEVKRQIDENLSDLQRTFSRDNDRSAIFAELERLVDQRVEMTRNYIALRRTNDLKQTVDKISAGGEEVADEIRVRIGQLKEAERRRLERVRAVAAATHTSTRKWIWLVAAVNVLLSLLALGVLRFQTRSRVAWEREMFAVNEYEINRVGHDLHDGLGQELTVVSLGLGTLARALEKEASAHARKARELSALVQRSIGRTSSVARSLALPPWTERGLRQGLVILAGDIDGHSGVSCTAHCGPDDDTHDPVVALQLFRIAQEAVTNALKHGKARNIELRFHREGADGSLTVLDDGVGIDLAQAHVAGLGLRSMRHRANALNGTLDVRRRPEGGTEVRCSLKLPVGGAGGYPAAEAATRRPRKRRFA